MVVFSSDSKKLRRLGFDCIFIRLKKLFPQLTNIQGLLHQTIVKLELEVYSLGNLTFCSSQLFDLENGMERLYLEPSVLRMSRNLRELFLLVVKYMLALHLTVDGNACPRVVEYGLHRIRWLNYFVEETDYLVECSFVQFEYQAHKLYPVLNLQKGYFLSF